MSAQLCNGGIKLVPVTKWPTANRLQCTGCSLKVSGKRLRMGGQMYIVTPSHRAVGPPKARKVDWHELEEAPLPEAEMVDGLWLRH